MRKSADGAVNFLIAVLAIGAVILIALLAATGRSDPLGTSLPFQEQYGSAAPARAP